MIVPVMAISNLVLTRQIYSEETNVAHAHNRDRVPLIVNALQLNELSALQNTFYPEYKYVCMYVCMSVC